MLGLQHRSLLLEVRGLGCADSCFLLLEQCFVRIGFDLHQQVAFLYLHPIFHRQLGNLPSNFRRNFHFGFGLNLPCRRDGLQNRPEDRFLSRHRDRLLALASCEQGDDQKQRCPRRADKNFTPAAGPSLLDRITS